MIAVLDAAYSDTRLAGACVLLAALDAREASETRTLSRAQRAEAYEPGALYKRELPILLELLTELGAPPSCVVLDGYVWLGRAGEPGLGARLFERLEGRVPVIGAAKSPFRGDDWSARVLRGASRRPLYVTAAGMDLPAAAEAVRSMHGAHRMPAMCKLADRLARQALAD